MGTVMEDFMNYKSGIYKYAEGNALGGHAVKIVGWGKDLNQFFWIVQNIAKTLSAIAGSMVGRSAHPCPTSSPSVRRLVAAAMTLCGLPTARRMHRQLLCKS